MGKKAKLLAKRLAEKEEEIIRLRRKLDGGVRCQVRFMVFQDGMLTHLTDMVIRTAGDGLGVVTDGGEEWILSSGDVMALKVGEVLVVRAGDEEE